MACRYPHALSGDVSRPARRFAFPVMRWHAGSGRSPRIRSVITGAGVIAPLTTPPPAAAPAWWIRADVLGEALDAVSVADDPRPRLYMSPRGRRLDQGLVRELADGPGAIMLCGRFEGIDERVIAGRDLIEVSIGDYVLSGGELAAMVMLDACVRLLPGVMGASASGEEESFESGLLEYPHYTRPREWEGRAIPRYPAFGRSRRHRALAARTGAQDHARTAPGSARRIR